MLVQYLEIFIDTTDPNGIKKYQHQFIIQFHFGEQKPTYGFVATMEYYGNIQIIISLQHHNSNIMEKTFFSFLWLVKAIMRFMPAVELVLRTTEMDLYTNIMELYGN